MKRGAMIALLLGSVACADQCGEKPAAVAPASVDSGAAASEGGWYHTTIEAPGAQVPFFLHLPASPEQPAAIVNGTERIDVPWSRNGDSVRVHFPMFDSSIEGKLDGARVLRGEWIMGPIGGKRRFPIGARPIAEMDPHHRFAPTAAPSVKIDGVWRVESERFGVAKGIFRQDANGVAEGTLLFQGQGDIRYLAGIVRGSELLLSRFNGHFAAILQANVEGDRMTGTLVWPENWNDEITATRAADVPIDYLHQAKLKKGKKRLSLNGLEKYAGKPVLVDLFGTWCSICIDMTPFLAELKKKYGPQGLEMMSVALELTDDAAFAEQQVERFRKAYGVDWEIAIVVGGPEKLGALLPPELTDIDGLPISVFVAKDGTVHAIHTGFAGPATGEEHQRVRAEFERLVKEIL